MSFLDRCTTFLCHSVAMIGMAGCASEPSRIPAVATGTDLSQRGRLLDASEMKELTKPGTRVTKFNRDGSFQTWTQTEDGVVAANTTTPKSMGGNFTTLGWGRGTSHYMGNQFCFTIEWISKFDGSLGVERQCRAIWALDGRHYPAPPVLFGSTLPVEYLEMKFAPGK
jgi:hypothetical protein